MGGLECTEKIYTDGWTDGRSEGVQPERGPNVDNNLSFGFCCPPSSSPCIVLVGYSAAAAVWNLLPGDVILARTGKFVISNWPVSFQVAATRCDRMMVGEVMHGSDDKDSEFILSGNKSSSSTLTRDLIE